MEMENIIDRILLDRRGLVKGAAAAAGAVLLPGGGLAQGTPRKGGILRVAMPYNPGSVDPMTGRNLTDFNVLYGVFDALVDFEPLTLELKPGLAKTWKFTDLKTLVLELVEGVSFHDGSPFNADAVKFNLDRYKNDPRSNVKSDLGSVETVEVSGPHQVTIRLNKPNVGLPTILTNRVGLMVSPKAIQEKGPNVDRTPVGTGPFKFVSWQDNDSFVLTRNENYWRPGLPYLDGINMRIISELNTVVRTVLAGETDVALNLQPQQKAVADRSSNVLTKVFPSLVPYTAFINYSRPPLDDARVRQALNYAINRDEINKVAALGLGQVSSTILSKALWACDPATASYYTYDVDKAKKLLAEAGHPNGIEIETIGWPDQTAMQRQELIISQLGKAGIRVKLTALSPQQAVQAFMVEKKGAMFISPSSPFADPSQFYENLFGKDALRNAGRVELPGFRELLDATMDTPDQSARKAAFAKLQRFVVENALQLVQFIAPAIAVMNPRVQNYTDGLPATPKFTQVWLSA
jgi:peptide/nickel transport system substrate-binding protein/glutathione transport system substrate-binding protein